MKDAVVVTFANGGTYDDFLCGLEDDIYSGAEFMSMMFMMTATTAESVCSAMDKGLAEYNNACQKYNEAKQKSSAYNVVEDGSGTVWDKITPTQENYINTYIPRSFEIDVNGQKMWVHGNASEHIYEDVYKGFTVGSGTAHTNPDLYSQLLLSDFHGSLESATKKWN